MHIEEVEIKNFRGINAKFNGLKKRFLIIGKNDSGKTNFCKAIQKVLDYKTRKKQFVESDSTESNKENISIKIVFNLKNISPNNRSNLGSYIESNGKNEEKFTVKLIGIFNEDTQLYEENIFLGSIDESLAKPAVNWNALDKVLNLIYVNPNYNLESDTKNYFNYHRSENNKNGTPIGEAIIDILQKLNETISSNTTIQKMQKELNHLQISEILNETKFKIESIFDISNIYKSLKIAPMKNDNVVTIGDGQSKMLALLLQKLTEDDNKEKIIILEEPENHLFPLLQKQFTAWADSLKLAQTIITTHSPEIIDLRKTDEIIKFSYTTRKNEESQFHFYKINTKERNIYKDFGYALNKEIAESFFYDEVLLIEGYSEKLFYNILVNTDECFRKEVLNKSIGFVCVYGVDFNPSKEILESLGIKVHILTDNDCIKVPNKKDWKRYSGIQRSFNLLKKDHKKQFSDILGSNIDTDMFSVKMDSDEHKWLENKMDEVIKKMNSFNIYVSKNGFESSFVNFLGINHELKDETIQNLKRRKMKNLHHYIINSVNSLKVTENNKKNILVKFIYE